MKQFYKYIYIDLLRRQVQKNTTFKGKIVLNFPQKIKWPLLIYCCFSLRTTAIVAQTGLSHFDSKKLLQIEPKTATPQFSQGETILNLVVEDRLLIPEESFILYQNKPNPFSKETVIAFDLLRPTFITLSIYDETGQILKEYKGKMDKGSNKILVSGKDLKEHGVLYYQMTTPDQILSKKMIYRKAKTSKDEKSLSQN